MFSSPSGNPIIILQPTCLYIDMHTNMFFCIYVRCAYTYAIICIYIYIHVYIYIYDTYYTCIHIYMQYATYVYNCMYIYIYTCVCVQLLHSSQCATKQKLRMSACVAPQIIWICGLRAESDCKHPKSFTGWWFQIFLFFHNLIYYIYIYICMG